MVTILPEPIQSIIVQYVIHNIDLYHLGSDSDSIKWLFKMRKVDKELIMSLKMFDTFLFKYSPDMCEWLINTYSLAYKDCIKGNTRVENFSEMWDRHVSLETIKWYVSYFKLSAIQCLGSNYEELLQLFTTGGIALLNILKDIFVLEKHRIICMIQNKSYYLLRYTKDVVELFRWIDEHFGITNNILIQDNYCIFRSLERHDKDGYIWLMNKLNPDINTRYAIIEMLVIEGWDSKFMIDLY